MLHLRQVQEGGFGEFLRGVHHGGFRELVRGVQEHGEGHHHPGDTLLNVLLIYLLILFLELNRRVA